jgi:hypothetical protein
MEADNGPQFPHTNGLPGFPESEHSVLNGVTTQASLLFAKELFLTRKMSPAHAEN